MSWQVGLQSILLALGVVLLCAAFVLGMIDAMRFRHTVVRLRRELDDDIQRHEEAQ